MVDGHRCGYQLDEVVVVNWRPKDVGMKHSNPPQNKQRDALNCEAEHKLLPGRPTFREKREEPVSWILRHTACDAFSSPKQLRCVGFRKSAIHMHSTCRGMWLQLCKPTATLQPANPEVNADRSAT